MYPNESLVYRANWVTIIIPSYNAEKIIDACLKSVLRETYPNFNIVFVDGGSLDTTIGIVKKYLDYLDSPHINYN